MLGLTEYDHSANVKMVSLRGIAVLETAEWQEGNTDQPSLN